MACTGLAFHSIPAAVTNGGGTGLDRSSGPRVLAPRFKQQQQQQNQHWRLLALNEEEAEITSIRGQVHHGHDDDDDVNNVLKRVVYWGIHFQRQAQRLFRELADGSFLMSFGPAEKKPERMPSRFKRKLPYTRAIRDAGKAEMIQSVQLIESVQTIPTKLPARSKSEFSKRSPIERPSHKHATLTLTTNGLPGAFVFQDVVVEAKQRQARPRTAFSRKSPVPSSPSSSPRSRRGKQVSDEPVLGPDQEKLGFLEVQPTKQHPSRPKATFVRKSPIHRPTKGRTRTQKDEHVEVATIKQQVVPDGMSVVEATTSTVEGTSVVESTLKRPSRPKAAFFRKSPITVVKGGRTCKRVEAASEVNASVSQVEEATSQGSEPQKKSSRRRRIVQRDVVETTATDVECSDEEVVVQETSRKYSFYELSGFTIQKLRGIARANGVRGYSKLRKLELIQLLQSSKS